MVGHITCYFERVAPSLIALENVVGLLSFGREAFLKLARCLQSADYSVAVQVSRSEVHGGVLQRRRRLFLGALRSPTSAVGWPGRLPMHSLPSTLAGSVRSWGARPTAPKAAAKLDAVVRFLAPCGIAEAESAHVGANCHSQQGRLLIGKTPCLTAARGAQGSYGSCTIA